jgi:hypothetical protein
MRKERDNTEATRYVKSLKDAVKRRFAVAYLEWMRSGRAGNMPGRGVLSPVLAKSVCTNLDSLS